MALSRFVRSAIITTSAQNDAMYQRTFCALVVTRVSSKYKHPLVRKLSRFISYQNLIRASPFCISSMDEADTSAFSIYRMVL